MRNTLQNFHLNYPILLTIFVPLVFGSTAFEYQYNSDQNGKKYPLQSELRYSIDNSVAEFPLKEAPGQIITDGVPQPDLATAFKSAKDHSIIRIRAGTYNQAATLKASYVKVYAEPGAVIYGKAVNGKGALLITGDNNYIEGLECHSIYVSSKNGVCVRLEGSNITLKNVYFHHSQGGLLGSPKAGTITIQSSKFEHLGDQNFFHAVYVLSKNKLIVENSSFLNTRNQGHEIKSRGSYNQITGSIIGSPISEDSRLIDIPNGGVLIVEGNILVEGAYSSNWDLIGWGLEGITHSPSSITIRDNLVISDRSSALLLNTNKGAPEEVLIENNLVVGNVKGVDDEYNTLVKSRHDIGLPVAPTIPERFKQ